MATEDQIEAGIKAVVGPATFAWDYNTPPYGTITLEVTTPNAVGAGTRSIAEYRARLISTSSVTLKFTWRDQYNAPVAAPAAKELTKLDVLDVAKAYGGDYREEHVSANYWRSEIEFHDRSTDRASAASQEALQIMRRGAITAFERKGRAPARFGGINNSPRMQCKRSQYHGFHPVDEKCPLCG